MPKLKKSIRDAENERLYGNIRYYMWLGSMDYSSLAIRLQVSERTVQRWMNDVSKLTWGDLISFSLVFGCEVADLTSGELTFETKKRVLA